MNQGTIELKTPSEWSINDCLQLERSLNDRLQPAGVKIEALFSFKVKAPFSFSEHFVLVTSDDKKSSDEESLDERNKSIAEIIRTFARDNETNIRTMLCDKGTGCVDLKTMDGVVPMLEFAENKIQAESCLEALEGVTVTGVFLIDGKLALVVDDGGQAGNLDTQIIAKIDACPILNAATLQVVRCSQGTGCVDLRA